MSTVPNAGAILIMAAARITDPARRNMAERACAVPTQAIDPNTWGPQEGAINTWFTNTIVR